MSKDSEYAIEQMRANPKLLKIFIAIVAVMVVLIVAGVAGNSALQKKFDEAMLKCQANELMDLSIDQEEPSTDYSKAKETCDGFLRDAYKNDKAKFTEEATKDFDNRTGDVAGHDKNWYLDHVKNKK